MKKGFSLSETLIALAIIGVVAAVTMPLVIKNHQKQVTVTKLKKIYSTLNQAMQNSIAENGDAINWVDTNQTLNYNNMKAYFDKYWAPYIKVAKYCDSASTCGYKAGPKGYYGGSLPMGMFGAARIGFIDPNGAYFLFRNSNQSKMGYYQNIFVDINGPKGPNLMGKDWFVLDINLDKNKVTATNQNGCYTTGVWSGCAYLIIQNGWKITYY